MTSFKNRDIEQFRKLATKERDLVRTSHGDWVGVYSALAMCLDHIADAGKKVREDSHDHA
jgi:hypothetical protein